MRRILRIELKKMWNNMYMYLTLSIGGLIAVVNIILQSSTYASLRIGLNPHMKTVYNSWLGGEVLTVTYAVFCYLLPVLAVLPYGWSMYIERSSGYYKNVIIRSGKKNYFLAKALAAFLSGGIAVVIPLLINFLILILILPSGTPDVGYFMYYGIEQTTIWANIFYSLPYLYIFLYLVLNFIFCGIFAILSSAGAFLLKTRVLVVALPFFVTMCLHYFRKLLAYKVFIEISPFNFLHAVPVNNPAKLWVICAEGGILLLFSVAVIYLRGIKYEAL